MHLYLIVKEINNSSGQYTNYIQHMKEYISQLSITKKYNEDPFAAISKSVTFTLPFFSCGKNVDLVSQ